MRLNHDKGQNKWTLYTHTHTQVIPEKTKATEGGRSMVEMLGTLAIIGVLSIGSIWALSGVMNRFRANDLLEEASARAMRVSEQIKKGRKTLSLGKFLHNETMGGTFSKQVFTSGLYQQFAIQVSDVNKAVCERVLNSITENTPLRRLSLVNSPTVAITECNDENTFLMVYNSSIKGEEQDKKYCESDKDCDTVCGECNENHICRNECEIPRPDLNSDFGQECGENECVVYDEESQSCKYSCERVEYLEGTYNSGNSYIDTGIKYDWSKDFYMNITASVPSANARFCLIGDYAAQGINLEKSNNKLRVYGHGGTPNNNSVNDLPKDNQKFNVQWRRSISNSDVDVILTTDEYTETISRIGITFQNVSSSSLKIFTDNRLSGTFITPGERIYSLYIKLGENIRDFIPVISPDGEPCMFDKVSKKLFRNSGTGTFKTNLDE
ncbi:MAG: hypothetical protein E7021_01165 [Alphaproteobacteria bacterium]|nr:hypothetical protein [Alphaproteobacteria bacterium]